MGGPTQPIVDRDADSGLGNGRDGETGRRGSIGAVKRIEQVRRGFDEVAARRQRIVASDIAGQIARGEHGIIGILLESFLVDGRQDLVDRESLVYGQSITDACMGWDMSVPVLRELAASVRSRREARVAVA